ncbi:hypothetical protein ABIA96_000611 [Bradyrhizobium sp. LB11.1]
MLRKNEIREDVLTLDEAELCVRMLEAATGEARPAAWTAQEALATVQSDLREQIIACARAATLFFRGSRGLVLH